MSILLFPGQGAQKVGMARDIAEAFPVARTVLERIDARLATQLSAVMWHGPEAELQQTHNTQPAILAHSAAVLAVVQPHLGQVVAAAGHSLGEYSAYVAAGALDAADAAFLVRRRGTLMFEAGQQRPGAMAAVLGLEAAAVAAACATASGSATEVVVAANFNGPDQTVISGDPAAVTRAAELCQAAGAKRVLPLKVSGAFHSPLMEPAVSGLRTALHATPFGKPAFPIMANASAELVHTTQGAVEWLAAQVTAPVRWVESMRRLAELHPSAQWLEIGPGNTLSGLLKRIVPGVTCTPLGTASEVEKWLAQ